ncbi:hypothetical protein bcere0007_26010 [Bacillus mycoides]|nr:hypothetical protein bcere0007_26010 [Bacillus mycoides]
MEEDGVISRLKIRTFFKGSHSLSNDSFFDENYGKKYNVVLWLIT